MPTVKFSPHSPERALFASQIAFENKERLHVYFRDGLYHCDRRDPENQFKVTHSGSGRARSEAVSACCMQILSDLYQQGTLEAAMVPSGE